MAARPGQADKGCKGDDAQTELHPGTKPLSVDREIEQTAKTRDSESQSMSTRRGMRDSTEPWGTIPGKHSVTGWEKMPATVSGAWVRNVISRFRKISDN